MSKLREARGTRLHHESQCAASCITSVCAYVLRLAPIDTAADDGGGTVGKNACDAFRVRAVSFDNARARLISRRVFDIPNYSEINLGDRLSADPIGLVSKTRPRLYAPFARLESAIHSFSARFYPFHAAKLFPLNRAAVRNNLIHYARLPRLVIFNAAIYTVCARVCMHTPARPTSAFSYLM